MATQKQDVTAFIYDKRGRIIAIGKNSYVKTHPMQFKYANMVGEPNKVFLHAEVAAIAACKDISKAHRMLVVRKTKSGNFGSAKPCSICAEAIKNETPIQIIEWT